MKSREDIKEIFTNRFFFGCEADDPMNALVFAKDINPHQTELRAIFASDLGHWDVRNFREVLSDTWELVEDGALNESQFRALTCNNAARLMTSTNPDFFKARQLKVSWTTCKT